MAGHTWTRRKLLQAGGAALALPSLIPSRAFGANEKVTAAIIGCGGRARSIVAESSDVAALEIAAICDCFMPRVEEFAKNVGKDRKWRLYDDFRQMLDKEKLDGVMVETTTHARAWIAIQAMQAGKNTYIEKPMCLTIAEGRIMVKAARKYNRVTQVGTQQRSIPMNNWASDLVKNGALGKIQTVLAPNFVGPELWPGKPAQAMPKGGRSDWWDLWTNQAEFRPYHVELHRGWDRWRDYDGGGRCFGVTGWGTHSYDQINRAWGPTKPAPSRCCWKSRCASCRRASSPPTCAAA